MLGDGAERLGKLNVNANMLEGVADETIVAVTAAEDAAVPAVAVGLEI